MCSYGFSGFRLLQQSYTSQHDGAAPHYSNVVSDSSSSKRPNNWIERGKPAAWPPRFPDLTPCKFFLWGHPKSKTYATAEDSIEELKRRIEAEIRGIGEKTLEKVRDNTIMRLNFKKKVEGSYIENIMD